MKLKLGHIFIFSLLTFFSVHANEDFAAGVKAYEAKDFKLAITHFENVITVEPNNRSAVYNLGLSYLSAEEFGHAKWAFETVLKYAPNDAEAKEFIRTAEMELTGEEWSPILGSFSSGLFSISSNTWAYVAIFGSILFLISIVVYVRNETLTIKRIMLLSSIMSMLFIIFGSILSYSVKSYQDGSQYGIIVDKSGSLKMENDSNDLIHEGQRVFIIDKDSVRYEVQTPNGQIGFISLDDLRLI